MALKRCIVMLFNPLHTAARVRSEVIIAHDSGLDWGRVFPCARTLKEEKLLFEYNNNKSIKSVVGKCLKRRLRETS